MAVEFSGYDHENERTVPVTALNGETGSGFRGELVESGPHSLVWDLVADWGGNLSRDFGLTVSVSALEEFVRVENGEVVSQVGTTEVTGALWDRVRDWGLLNGYTDLGAGASLGESHPVQSVTWYDVVKWCNARSEMERLTPVYTVDDEVFRTGTSDTVFWHKSRSGYRLPALEEWQFAARGGLEARRFPWGDTITHRQANYLSDASYAYDTSSTRGYHPEYAGESPYTSPFGSFAANDYGLYEVAGNVSEWCWDRAELSREPLDERVHAGGSALTDASLCRIDSPGSMSALESASGLGLRLCRTQNLAPAAVADAYENVPGETALEVDAPGVLANDSDANGDWLTTSLVSDPDHGTLTLSADGSFTYTPSAGFTGTDSFSYRVSDGELESDAVTVSLEVRYRVTFDLGSHGTFAAGGGDLVQYLLGGAAATAPAFTVEAGWEFAGWDTAFDPVTANLTVTAEYDEKHYTVTFDPGDHGTRTGGGALSQIVVHGSAAEAPTVEAYEGWLFEGWDTAFDSVTSDLAVTAQYSPASHTVTFDLGDHGTRTGGGDLVQEVDDGQAAEAPTVEAASGWLFTGWDTAFGNVTSDLTVTAQYQQYTPPLTVDFALIPAGSNSGTNYLEPAPFIESRPSGYPETYNLVVDAFYMAKHEVTKALWDEVRTWAVANGYELPLQSEDEWGYVTQAGLGKGPTHPVYNVNWYDTVKWLNAWSEKEGRVPCYYADSACTQVYRTGDRTMDDLTVRLDVNGYRLPTGDEWEYAGRGGLVSKRYPWGDFINHDEANYESQDWYTSDNNAGLGYGEGHHPDWDDDPKPYTSVVGSFPANGYGLYDMAGNVWEWCWGHHPAYPEDALPRGGSWDSWPSGCRVGSHNATSYSNRSNQFGFRAAVSVPAYTVTFSLGDHGTRTGGGELSQTVVHGAAATAPNVEVAAGWMLDGWDTAFDNVTSDLTVTAEYAEATPTRTYVVIDLSAGSSATSYPWTELDSVPAGGWTTDHKTTKLVLRRIPAGTFTMGSPGDPAPELGRNTDETQHSVTLTQDLYVGVFEVTQAQWERVMGTWPSYFNNTTYRDTRPVEQVSWDDIRGGTWPGDPAGSGAPVAGTFVKLLRDRTGLNVDLPTESQWEYACRAGTTTALNSGKNLTSTGECPNMAAVGRYYYNGYSGYTQGGDTSKGTAAAGSYQANAWGLYDMHGNVWEWCADWYGTYPGTVTDPLGSASGSNRVIRGGSWIYSAGYCRSARRNSSIPTNRYPYIGFRLALPAGQP
jgi:formylglycine-generating enzyme required for sulfatase activity